MSETPDLAALFGAADVETFLGLPACPDLDRLDAPAALIGAPGATPYGSVGAYCRNAPGAIRAAAASLAANIDRMNFDLGGPSFPEGCRMPVDCGDLPFDPVDFAANRAAIAAATRQILRRGAVPVVLGGDDSVPIPMLEALGGTGARYTVLQIDAHIDWRREHMGEAMGLSSTMRRASEMRHVARIIQVGARSIGSAHPDDLRDAEAWGVEFFPAAEVHRSGVAPIIDRIGAGEEVVVCFDADALDPAIVPGVIGRAPGGLGYFQALDLIRGAAGKGRIAAMDLVEYLPEADVDGIGALTLSRLLIFALSIIARQEAGMPVA